MRILAAIAAALCFSSAASAAPLDVRLWAQPQTFDLQLQGGEFQDAIFGDLYEGLVTDAADGSIIAGQAASWTVSPDGLTYTFTLRDDARWTDGTPVVAGDFVYAMRRMVAPATAAEFAYILGPINAEAINAGEVADATALGVAAPDDRTLVITLNEPTPYFLEALAQFPAYPLPQHAMAGIDFTRPETLVTNGPYRFGTAGTDGSVTLVRNGGYYDAAEVKVDEVVYHFAADDLAAADGFTTGTYDIVTRFDAASYPALKAKLGAEVRLTPWTAVQWIALKLDLPPLDRPEVREAMSMAIDRDRLAGEVVQSWQLPAYGLVPPGTPGFEGTPYAPQWAALPYPERLAKAKATMTAAGYTEAQPLKLVIRTSTRPDRVALSQGVADMWKPIGIDATLLATDIPVHQPAMFAGDFEAGAAHWVMDYADPFDTLKLLTSGMPINYGHYSNAAFDALLASTATETDAAARFALLRRAEVMAMADTPVVPVYWYVSRNLVSSAVRGFLDNVRDVHRTRWLSQ